MRNFHGALLFTACALVAVDIQAAPPVKPEAALLYSYQEMQTFDLAAYLREHAPALLPQAEVISHWAGYSSISPKVLLTLIEMHSAALSKPTAYALAHPFGPLSTGKDFSAQVEEIALRLARDYYQRLDARTLAPSSHALAGLLPAATGEADFAATYGRLFGQRPPTQDAKQRAQYYAAEVPPANLLQLPFPVGQSWGFGGSHTNTGSGNFPLSSLDFHDGGYWGSDTSNKWVVAAAEGRAIRHSSCSVEVVHNGGWSTTYYHLDNVQIQTNQIVRKNQRLANYAGNINQALCNGGHSTGPHQHFSLKRNGAFQHLNGVQLSGYRIHTGRDSYDTDCSYFWLDRNGQRYCVGYRLQNPGTPVGRGQAREVEANEAPGQRAQVTSDYRSAAPIGATNLYMGFSSRDDAPPYSLSASRSSLDDWGCRPFDAAHRELCRFTRPATGAPLVMLDEETEAPLPGLLELADSQRVVF
ncbi:peptidoglycan DD-metalloendopeptidase family protein [Pseudomonas sp. RIT-PI-AD]|uniref:M23 family metallopeptidase n=1 Tax=Pseudomonas sp. RIT-PI-AD TaxID=3035294 RepID=UPI0021D80A8D|nr:peptidoglycan DD-metalloendopeptidase family protein [Pseudomonas sp. RIT-PI-AD]